MNVGPAEVILVAAVALLLFGPKKLPELARTLGRALSEFRRASRELTDEFTSGIEEPAKQLKEFPPPGPRG